MFQEFQMHFVRPRHTLNGGGPISAREVLQPAEGTGAKRFAFLRNYNRVSLSTAGDASCILSALLRDGVDVDVESRDDSHRTSERLRGRGAALELRAATLLVRIPGSAFLEVSCLLEARLLDYYKSVAHLGPELRAIHREGGTGSDRRSLRWSRSSCNGVGRVGRVQERVLQLNHLELLSTSPELTAATLTRILVPRVTDSSRLTAGAAKRRPWRTSDPHVNGTIKVRLGRGPRHQIMVSSPRDPQQQGDLRLFESYLKLLRGEFSTRSFWRWEPFMDFHVGVLLSDCIPTLEVPPLYYYISPILLYISPICPSYGFISPLRSSNGLESSSSLPTKATAPPSSPSFGRSRTLPTSLRRSARTGRCLPTGRTKTYGGLKHH